MSLEVLDDADATFLCMIQEDIIYSVVGDVKVEEMPDFIVTEDVTGVNAGIFIGLFSTPIYMLESAVLFLLFVFKPILLVNFPIFLRICAEKVSNSLSSLRLIFLECDAGMFFFRSSDWSRQFLDRWWNQTGFIQPFGQSKSGDNTALKHLISFMDKDEFKRHVRVPEMQCLFNSNLWRPSWRSCHRLITVTKAVWQGRLFSSTLKFILYHLKE